MWLGLLACVPPSVLPGPLGPEQGHELGAAASLGTQISEVEVCENPKSSTCHHERRTSLYPQGQLWYLGARPSGWTLGGTLFSYGEDVPLPGGGLLVRTPELRPGLRATAEVGWAWAELGAAWGRRTERLELAFTAAPGLTFDDGPWLLGYVETGVTAGFGLGRTWLHLGLMGRPMWALAMAPPSALYERTSPIGQVDELVWEPTFALGVSRRPQPHEAQ